MSEVDAFCAKSPAAEAPLHALLVIVARAEWRNTTEAKHQFGEIASIDGPDKVRLDLPEHGLRVEMIVNFRDGAVRLRLSPRPRLGW
jgi:mRNA-degrading endonuclease HigB of HigAB toxin-antitoxin module